LLSETLQLSQNTIQKCLRELEAEKIIKISKIRKFTSYINSYVFLTENKALPKVDTSNIDTSVDTSVDTSNHTSKFDYKPIEPREPSEPNLPPTPLAGDSGGRCLKVFYESNNREDFKAKCYAIAKAKRFSESEAEKHFAYFENHWLNPALPPSKALKKDWQRAFVNWIAKDKPIKVNNFDTADYILSRAKERLSNYIDHESETIDSNLVFLKLLKNGYTKEQIFSVFLNIIKKPPEKKIHSWGIITQYM
jgi:hypothetical protein